MSGAIFLSASVPEQYPQYLRTANTVAIAAAVSALAHVTLGRRLLIWGGHPAITPMIWAVAEGLGVDYASWVKLYQSKYFADEYPEDDKKFQNTIYTKNIDNNRELSLRAMREQMFSDFDFTASVFVGGMQGIIQEFELLRKIQPETTFLPVFSTGGATRDIARLMERIPADLNDDLDYIALFHRHLGVSVKEERYRSPDEQPEKVEDRFWSRRHPRN